MRTGQMGILALAFLIIIITVPSAFADDDANTAFTLMEKITNAQEELFTLDTLITSNGLNMGKGLTEYADALDLAAGLTASEDPDDWDRAAEILDGSENTLDDIYKQLDAQIESRQNERFTEFVDKAKTSISFILANADTLGISEAVYDELDTTLTILESGDYEAISAATSEDSNLGRTASMFPDDHPGFGNASPDNNGKEKGIGLGEVPPGLQKLPPGIKKKFDIPTDSNVDTVTFEGTGNGNGNGESELNEIQPEIELTFISNELSPGLVKKLAQSGDEFDDVVNELALSGELPPGIVKQLAINGDLTDDVVGELALSGELPPGIVRQIALSGDLSDDIVNELALYGELPPGIAKKLVGNDFDEYDGVQFDDSGQPTNYGDTDDSWESSKYNDNTGKKLDKKFKNEKQDCSKGQCSKGAQQGNKGGNSQDSTSDGFDDPGTDDTGSGDTGGPGNSGDKGNKGGNGKGQGNENNNKGGNGKGQGNENNNKGGNGKGGGKKN